MHGLDDVARTMLRDAEIADFESTHPARFDTRTLATTTSVQPVLRSAAAMPAIERSSGSCAAVSPAR